MSGKDNDDACDEIDARTAEQSHLVALAERDTLTAQVDVLTRALRQACYDGWADGEGAMAGYIEQAERAGGAR